MSAALVGHLEQSFFPSFTFINFTQNSSPSLHSSVMLENVMNQNESVQSEKGSWAKFYTQDRTSGRRTGLSTDFDSNTAAESFIAVGHKAGVKIDKKPVASFFSLPFLPHYCSLLLLYEEISFLRSILQSCFLLGPKQWLETVPDGLTLSCYVCVFLGTIVMLEDFD